MNVSKILVTIFSIASISMLTVGCINIDQSGQIIGDSGLVAPLDLEGTAWQLRAFEVADARNDVLPDTEVTIAFADGQVSGTAGCNGFFGPYELINNQLTLKDLGSTLMLCDDKTMQQEIAFLEALQDAQSITWEEDTLMIHYGDQASLVFDRHQMIDQGGLHTEQGLVTGQIVVRDMIDFVELPEDATITVRLEDVSLADAPSTVLSEQVYDDVAQLPLSYELSYDLGAINEAFTYAVSARIEDAAGNLLFINDTMHPVLTRGAGDSVDVELIPINR